MDRIESIILRGLMYDADYMRRVLPFIKEEYFTEVDKIEKTLFVKVKEFIDLHNTLPTKETIIIELKDTGIDQDDLSECVEYLNELEVEKDTVPDQDWLTKKTEDWCKKKAIHIAVVEVIEIMGGKSKTPEGMIPKLLEDALAVSFDPHIGHDYLDDAESRFEFYHRVDAKIPFRLKYFNKITKNGVPKKTLNICLAGTNVGKSLFMCDLAAYYLEQGKNVLYITMEMAEERIAERIDANMMDRPVDDLEFMSKELYMRQITKINERAKGGRLIIKEYPTALAHVGHFRFLLSELNLKKKFKPDVIFIDYLNICASSRVNAKSGMYELVKGIAEEIRGLAVEIEVPIWSATQMNRAGFSSSDPDLTNTSESFGLPATADFMFALINSDELTGMNQLLVKVLKNRYGDVNMRNKETGKIMSKFAIGVDRSKQKLFDLDESAQKGLEEIEPVAGPAAEKAILMDDEPDEPDPTQTEDFNASTRETELPTKEYNSAEEDAERRRETSVNKASLYQPKQTITGTPFKSGQKKNKLNT